MITLMVSDSLTFREIEAHGEPVQLCSPDGNVLGVFTPTEIRPRRKLRTPEEEAAYWTEVERRAANPGEGIPLREVYRRVLPLAKQHPSRPLTPRQIDPRPQRAQQSTVRQPATQQRVT